MPPRLHCLLLLYHCSHDVLSFLAPLAPMPARSLFCSAALESGIASASAAGFVVAHQRTVSRWLELQVHKKNYQHQIQKEGAFCTTRKRVPWATLSIFCGDWSQAASRLECQAVCWVVPPCTQQSSLAGSSASCLQAASLGHLRLSLRQLNCEHLALRAAPQHLHLDCVAHLAAVQDVCGQVGWTERCALSRGW